MALQKQAIPLNFVKGLETKADPFQIPLQNFTTLVNTVFGTTGRLTKRNGFNNITLLPNADQTILTTFNDNLVATGSNLYTFNQESDIWVNQGKIQPVTLSTQSLVRNSSSQTDPFIAIADSRLSCFVYMDSTKAYYHVVDSITGQQIVGRTQLPSTATNPKVFVFGAYFMITFIATVAATPTLEYIAVSIANPTVASAATTISSDVNGLTAGYDALPTNTRLFLAWGASAGALKAAYISRSLTVSSTTTVAGNTADLLSMTIDTSSARLYVSYWEDSSNDGFSIGFDYNFNTRMSKTQIINNVDVHEITNVFANGVLNVFYENINTYSYSAVETDYISKLTVAIPPTITTGTPSSTAVMLRSVGLVSQAFVGDDGIIYMMVAYGDMNQSPSENNSNQPTYFLVDSTGAIYMRLAYSNGGGYARSNVLSKVIFLNGSYYVPYMITDFLATVNKGTNMASGQPVNAIFTQTGVNLAKFELNDGHQYNSEIASALHLTGGQLWEFDGVKPVEHGFHVWPENIDITTADTGGDIDNGTYYYVFTYEWTDNQGMLQRSAPSIPFKVVTTGSDTSENTIEVPTLRLTYKDTTNPVRIVGYRWSLAQQVYYQFTSITSPILNDTTVDSVEIIDDASDADILGQTILYTTGGVIENIAAPANSHSTLFDNRMWLIDAEDQNLLWFSKQVIESVPVEFSDLLTMFVSPTIGSQGPTGPMKALAPMDDKLVIFKSNAIYYVNGSGPDNTGANNSYSQPTYITAAVGTSNPNSLALIPQGLMFQSNKGIWLLGRGLDTQYIGAPVERYNDATILSAEAIPNTTQVRFILDSGVTLMYDYFYNQWGTHTNIKAISGTIYQGAHTYLNTIGTVYKETPGSYKDGSSPVLISLTTAWINLAGLQGYERFYFANLLGTYYTPFNLQVQFAFDYNPSPIQSTLVTPVNNVAPAWGDEAVWGSGGPWGGSEGNVFSARVFPTKQKCEAFQVTIQEAYDPSYDIDAGQGLSLSGLNLIVGTKRGFRTQSAAKSFG